MKFLKQGLCLALLGAGLAAVPGTLAEASAPAAAADKSLLQQIKDGADGTVVSSEESATGKIGFLRVRGANADLMPQRDAQSAAAATAKADAFLAKYSAAFGAARGELVREQVTRDAHGWTVTYRQSYRGVDVFGAMIRAHVDRDGDLTAVNGYAAPDLSLSVSPRLSAAEAGRAAVAAVKADPPGHDGESADASGVRSVRTELVVYRTGVPRGDRGEAVLAYVVEVSNRASIRDMVFLDANTGKPVNRYSLIHDALDRELYEASPLTIPIWREGDPFPGVLTQDQQNLVQGTGESYQFFMNAFGRDSYDGAGITMKTVNNDPTISCPNANWNGSTTNYCNGVTSDDVVAHEWGHAYTEYTWDGIYQWQPGALNESYSDIWGETIDLINGRMDADEGAITTPRTVGRCSTHSPATPVVVINSPADIAKNCEAGAAQFGPQLDGTGITGDVALGDDGVAPGSDACTALVNAAEVAGKIALVDRGTCNFTVKVKNAQNAGAVGVLVADNVEAPPSPMAGTDPTITIPSVRIRLSDGNLIKSKLSPGPVNVTMKDAAGAREDSYRWLMGEDSTAFGGAIRDMWHPNCYGDPGKVSDAQYFCDTSDGGGVHSNSGVPNHGYSLLVDGGTFNGQTITGIGLTKAAHIYWRAQSVYQTPTTDFVDHANALEQSCADLVGGPVEKGLSTAGAPHSPSPPPLPDANIAAGDCTQVANMIAAVELRREPTQCNFQPLLKPGGPTCGKNFDTKTVWKEDFEDGLAGWAAEFELNSLGGGHLPWEADNTPPGGRTGGTARGVGTGEGDCQGGAGDFSSRDSIISPVIALPGTVASPMLTFDHYVATEFGYDGGNVKYSVNGGPFTLIPDAAYKHNPYNATMNPPSNTSPLNGQRGFTGTDGGVVRGSWGTSFIDLKAIGADPGEQLRLRFDFGRDGCGGLDGWYVDNVQVTTCEPKGDETGKVKSTTRLRVKPRSPEFKENFKAKIRVRTETGVVPTGRVKLLADGKRIGSGRLVEGRLVIFVKRNLRPGEYRMVAKYLGSKTVKKSRDKVIVTIRR